jgi:hypothetical protein
VLILRKKLYLLTEHTTWPLTSIIFFFSKSFYIMHVIVGALIFISASYFSSDYIHNYLRTLLMNLDSL